jgi:hypothetical protein
MPRYATFDELRQQGARIDVTKAYTEASRSAAGKSLFLSHSAQDLPHLGGVIEILEGHGASVYVDAFDLRLPKDPSPKTAEILKSTIKECSRFVLFLTPNTVDSRWIPWELGLADWAQTARHLALFPASDKPGLDWAEREYLGLYQRIVWGRLEGRDDEWLVYDHFENKAEPLKSWIALWSGIL